MTVPQVASPVPRVSQAMCAFCFAVLVDRLNSPSSRHHSGRNGRYPRESPRFSGPMESVAGEDLKRLTPPLSFGPLMEAGVTVPMFVTWMKKRRGCENRPFEGCPMELRGCIGTLDPQPITEMERYVERSAFNDSRFRPVSREEVSLLSCKVSLLLHYEPCRDPWDWDLAVHGIIVKFRVDDAHYTATFLPHVARDHGMSKTKALTELVAKAGYMATVGEEFLKTKLTVTRYQSVSCSLTFDEFIRDFCQGDLRNSPTAAVSPYALALAH